MKDNENTIVRHGLLFDIIGRILSRQRLVKRLMTYQINALKIIKTFINKQLFLVTCQYNLCAVYDRNVLLLSFTNFILMFHIFLQ